MSLRSDSKEIVVWIEGVDEPPEISERCPVCGRPPRIIDVTWETGDEPA